MRKLIGVLLILMSLAVIATCVLWIGAFVSLDRNQHHTRATAKLAAFNGEETSDLVLIKHEDMVFRARAAGFYNVDSDSTKNLILLHGFPETSIMWAPLIEAAAIDGFRVVAFDQRGYSPGARPVGHENYGGRQLSDDVLAIADAAGFETFHLVGHDWGAGVGWQTVLTHPDRVTSWTALSIPHIAAFGAALQQDSEQRSKSAYMGFFRLPWLAEQVFTFNNLSILRNVMYAEHPDKHVDEYLRVFAEPGALTAALNWYRAATDSNFSSLEIDTPTLFIWGNKDPAVGRAAVAGQRQFMQGPFKEVELDTGHWLMATKPEPVTDAILEHLNSHL